MNQGTDSARIEADKYKDKVSVSMRYHGEIYIGTAEYTTISDAIRKAFFDGYSKGREDTLEEQR